MGGGGFPKLGVPFLGPQNKDYSILGSMLGSPYLGKLPYGLRSGALSRCPWILGLGSEFFFGILFCFSFLFCREPY